MNDNFQNRYYESNESPGYYELYTEQKVREAKAVFSRYHLGLFLYTAVAYAVILIAQILVLLIMGQEKGTAVFDNVYVEWLMGVGPMYFIGFPIFYLIIKGMKKRTYEKRKLGIGEWLVLFLMAEGAMMAGNIIGTTLNTFMSAILRREISNATLELIESSPLWLIILVVVIIGPIIEELLFRKFMIDRLGRYGDTIAITVSAVAFGLFHGNFYQFFYAAMLGLILGYIYTRTGNWIYTCIMHMIINFMGSVLVIPIIKLSEKITQMDTLITEGAKIDLVDYIRSVIIVASYSVIEYALAFAGIALIIIFASKRMIKINKDCEYRIPRYRTAGVIFGNVGVILFLILSLVMFGMSIFIA